jgi:sugar lactone lactonase YvrE
VEIVTTGFQDLTGVAVAADGAIVVTDREEGTLTRIDVSGGRRVLLNGLRYPTGVAIDRTGDVLVLEQAGNRLLRLAADGRSTTVSSTIRDASAVAVGPDGRVWLAVRRAGTITTPNQPAVEFVVGRLDAAGTLVPVASGFMDVRGLAGSRDAVYVVQQRLVGEVGSLLTTLARIGVNGDGSTGRVESLLRSVPHEPRGVAVDAAGEPFIGGLVNDGANDGANGVILKRRSDGQIGTFASALRDAAMLAFGPNGDLVAIERKYPGRVLRFRAPPAPVALTPSVTNRTPVALRGRATSGARVTAARADAPNPPLGSAIANSTTGAFSLSLTLVANATTNLLVDATVEGGAGLASLPTPMRIVHDNISPAITVLSPHAGMHTQAPISASARAEDDRSGVVLLRWSMDGTNESYVQNPKPESPLLAKTVLAIAGLVEGPHSIGVTVTDRAGNVGLASTLVVVDRTPPDTSIVSGPAAETAERTATFVLSGEDAWSLAEQLDFSWRLDGGPWSAFEARTAATLSGLSPGAHRFEARARDMAGNEDLTPTLRVFTVRPLQIRITEPAASAVIETSTMWVRGTVDGGVGEVTVSVVLPPGASGEIAGPVEGGTFALEAPAEPEFSTLTLVAKDAAGNTSQASASVVLARDGTVEQALDVWPPGGLAPLTVRIGLYGLGDTQVSIDFDGDGTSEFEGQPSDDSGFVTYSQPGLYVPTLRFTGDDGIGVVRRGVVEVYDRAVLDARLQEIWSGFKAALRAGDPEAAVSFIGTERRQAWAEYFETLPAGALANVDRLFSTITLVDVGSGGAQYEMVGEREGLLYSYAVWFQVDADGRWRLWRF